jgi:hypothetical protein
MAAELHGEALLAARRPELQPLIDHLREVAQGRDDLRIEVAGVVAGSWFAGGGRRGEDVIAARLVMLAGPVDLDELDRWIRTGWERRRRSTIPYAGRSCELPSYCDTSISRRSSSVSREVSNSSSL